ncbi:MAG: hypothetical protein P9L99_11325 [Candidatus Lernaella stagnicola]|nr:hypothetical protein [Candidatus Lernaella stagnicola]
MQPLKLTIGGNYWDSYLYQGRLFLFQTDGSLKIINWDKFVEGYLIDENLRLAFECGFRRSDYLYGSKWKLLFKDTEIKDCLIGKFRKLSLLELELEERKLDEYCFTRKENPLPFPHSDVTVYRKTLYSTSREGIFKGLIDKRRKSIFTDPPVKMWDCPSLSVSASYMTLAISAGSEGLYETKLIGQWEEEEEGDTSEEPSAISNEHCSSCEWTYHSIFGSSHKSGGFLADFSKEKDGTDWRKHTRKFEGIFPSSQIFGQNSRYSWGSNDKLCQAHAGAVSIVKYSPWDNEGIARFQDMGTITLAPWKGEVVSGGTALFGTIIECDNALIVVPSQGDPITIPGEPVNWRVFPRSKHYENHLHIIYDDHIDILSFNQDYFVDQKVKRSGTRYYEKHQF